MTKGSDADWLSLDVIEGPAGEETTVKITCEPSTSSKLRHAVITLASADTRKNIHVVQSAAGQELDSFISVSTGNAMSAVADENTIKMTVQANVEFESSTDVDWLTIAPKTRALVAWYDVEVNVAANKASTPRVGHVIFSNAEKNIQSVVTVTQEAFSRGTGYLPVIWHLGDNINFSQTFPESVKVMPVENDGYIQYVPYDVAGTDANKKYKLDVSGDNPRVTGPWPGDYWYFCSNAPAKAGDEVTISLETRTSGTGHKFWRLEYKDGEEWKVAGTPLTTSEPGETITYTHAMNADGSTNVFVNTTVTYSKDTEIHEFRFVCAANWQANGKGALAARNGGSARLSVTDPSDEYSQPMIQSGKGGRVPRVYFEDDFSWVKPFVEAYNATAAEGKKVGDTIGDKNKGAEAPNVYGDADWQKSFQEAFKAKGYEDMLPSAKLVYLQPHYLKFSRTGGNNTSLRLPELRITGSVNLDVAFDWAAMVQGTGDVDNTKLVVVIEGDGEFENGTKFSDVLEQKQGKDELFWTHSSVKVLEATSKTRFVIVMNRVLKTDADGKFTGEYNYGVSGAGRFFLDNIKISKAQ